MSHKQSQFASKLILSSVRYVFKQSNLMGRPILWAASFTSYKLATKNLHVVTAFLQLVAKRHPEDNLVSSPVLGGPKIEAKEIFYAY